VLSPEQSVDESGKEAAEQLTIVADSLLIIQKSHPYRITFSEGDFFWGSNSHAANIGIVYILAYRATEERRYRDAALHQFDYLFGRNPTGYSFITGFGVKSPRFIHHRPSTADGIAEPVPGFLAGGPNGSQQDRRHCDCYATTLPALSYVDSTCSYASNEVAINWNAPLVFLSGAMEVLFASEPVVRMER
jgi:endoglucanase